MTSEVKHIAIESIDPKKTSLSFGCVSLGFVYRLAVTLTNVQNFSQRYKFIISKDLSINKNNTKESSLSKTYLTTEDNDIINDDSTENSSFSPSCNSVRVISQSKLIAPGMKIDFVIELSACIEKYSKYSLTILQSGVSDIIVYNVRAFVIPPDVYRTFRRTKQIHGQNMAVDGVHVVRAIGMYDDNRSIASSTSSVNSVAFMDEDDVEELLDFPILANTYWDPFCKQLKVDSKLTQVYIDPSMSAEGCMQRTQELRGERYCELEDTGYYTIRMMDGFRHAQHEQQS